MIKYELIEADTKDSFLKEVNDLAKKGFKPTVGTFKLTESTIKGPRDENLPVTYYTTLMETSEAEPSSKLERSYRLLLERLWARNYISTKERDDFIYQLKEHVHND